MKKTIIMGLLALIVNQVNAQFWSGNNNTWDPIHRTGNVGIGIGSSPNYNLVVKDNTGAQPKVLLGGTSLLPNTTSGPTYTILESQSEGDVVHTFYSHIAGSQYDGMWLGTNNTFHTIHCFGENKSSFPFKFVMRDGNNPSNYTNIEALTIWPDGKTGINTASSSLTEQLTVNGDLAVTSVNATQYKHINGRSAQGTIGLYADDGINNGAGITISGDDEQWYAGGIRFTAINSAGNYTNDEAFSFSLSNPPSAPVNIMTIYKDGNVGIGTTAALNNTKLAVEGLIACRELKVLNTNTAWPDYVFADDYEIMSLQHVEKYIKENKHLPQLPAASEIEQNGIKIAETQTQILQAVEELYLHVIDLKKENEQLKLQIANMKN